MDRWDEVTGYNCASCRFFVPKGEQQPGAYGLGRCRRHAPTLEGYPVVYGNDWCGDHKLGTNPSKAALAEQKSLMERAR